MPKQKPKQKNTSLRLAVRWGGLPLLIYFILFCLLTWPWVAGFSTHFMTDQGDGMQNVWNMWWINKSVTELGQNPWFTDYLHHPFGVTLVGQTLNPFNGFMAVLLLPVLSLVQAYNVMVVFSFIVAGLTMFWLCYYFSGSYYASLAGGLVFTFSSYHLAHAAGHMQLVSLEWIPLFILMWWKFVKQPSSRLGAGVAVSLLLVLLCDYYYFLYCILAAIGIAGYLWYRKEVPNLRLKKYRRPLAVLGVLGCLLVAPLPIALLRAVQTSEFLGSHPARVFSTDLLSPFINGGLWVFADLTKLYWSHLDANLYEATVYLGVSVLSPLVLSVVRRTRLSKDLVFWQILLLVFATLSLGPRLLLFGISFEMIPLPYSLMEKIIPGMQLSGMPVRMMVMVTLAAGVVVSMVVGSWKGKRGALLAAGFAALFLVEMWPQPLPRSSAQYPNYVHALKKLPATGAVIDDAAQSDPLRLFYQTGHEKKVPFGYVSRLPKKLAEREQPIADLVANNHLDRLCNDYNIRYLTTRSPRVTNYPAVYKDATVTILDLKNAPGC